MLPSRFKQSRLVAAVAIAILCSMLLFWAIVWNAGTLSDNEAMNQIKVAMDANFSMLKQNFSVKILGTSVDGKTAVVKAEIYWALGPWVYNFYFRKYDRGWVLESYQ